jgi:hypothetical protein
MFSFFEQLAGPVNRWVVRFAVCLRDPTVNNVSNPARRANGPSSNFASSAISAQTTQRSLMSVPEEVGKFVSNFDIQYPGPIKCPQGIYTSQSGTFRQ